MSSGWRFWLIFALPRTCSTPTPTATMARAMRASLSSPTGARTSSCSMAPVRRRATSRAAAGSASMLTGPRTWMVM